MLATLRHAGKRFSALLLLLAVLLGGAVEAMACEPAVSAAPYTAVAFDLDDGLADDAAGGQSEQHALCPHGHCHHGPQTFADSAPISLSQTVGGVRPVGRENKLEPRITDTLKRPPRA